MANEENKNFYFLNIDLEHFRCFKEKVKLDLSDEKGNWKKWTVILGDNGTGKTSLLQCLANFEVLGETNHLGSSYYPRGYDFSGTFLTHDSIIKASVNAPNWGVVELSYSYNEYNFHFKNNVLTTDDLIHFNNLKCYGYGANRFMSKDSLSDNKTWTSETLFKANAKLINAEEWLLELDYAANKPSQIKEFAKGRRDQVEEILIDILPDITKIRFTEPTKKNLKQSVEFLTPYGWVTMKKLSLGYKTMVAWMVDLAARLFDRYPGSDNPLAEPAIVLIDEIDLHLHPKWQRKIFNYLDEKFPATQFIVAAHSPLVVQSAPSDANIVLLRREGDHVVIDQDIQSVRSWRLDQILSSDLFGVGSRSPEIETLMEERRKLIQKNNLTAKENIRLEKLNGIEYNLPTAESQTDIEAMEVIRKAADYLKTKQ